LCIFPFIAAIASPILGVQSEDDYTESLKNAEQARIAASAATVLKEVLIGAIKNFIEALTAIAGFFAILESELDILARTLDDEVKLVHYLKCKARAAEIVTSCHIYIGTLPGCKADIDVIPGDFDQNYVDKWIVGKKGNNEDNKSVLLLDWGKILFAGSKPLLALLG